MMKRSNLMIAFCLTLMIFVNGIIAKDCDILEWKCKNGDCIDSDELCDGQKDCPDGSDETSEACVHVRCQSYTFRCAYGACVKGVAECDGVQDCADNSDETTFSCVGSKIHSNGNCSEEEFQCKSGECISSDDVCDGPKNCPDGSDEIEESCKHIYCPETGFRCDYGGCIPITAKCDYTDDCADGSDETPGLCSRDRIISQPSSGITPRPSVPVVSDIDITKVPPGSCMLTSLEKVISFFQYDPTIQIRSGGYVENFMRIAYKCPVKHFLIGEKENVCLDGKWVSDHPQCIRYCHSKEITGVTFEAYCEYNGEGVSCYQALKPGTRARIGCKVGYTKPNTNPPPQDILICLEDGEWDYRPFSCVQVCGTESIHGTPFILGGETINNTLVPWNAGIYSRKKTGRYDHICGGTIINPKLVVSAAHCFWDLTSDATSDKSFYAVAVGKYYRDFYADEETSIQTFNISELVVPPGYKDIHLYYQSDIALLVLNNFIIFKMHIKPICINWSLSYKEKYIPSDTIGRVAGWGKIDSDGKLATELRVTELLVIDDNVCAQGTDKSFRNLITGDKFCVGSDTGESSVCEGDSGSGFAVPNNIDGTRTYYLWGVVSNGLTSRGECHGNYYTAFTNVLLHSDMIIEYLSSYRPK